MYRLSLLSMFAVLASGYAAPAPPTREGTAEAVVNSFGQGDEEVRKLLVGLLPYALGQPVVWDLPCFRGVASRERWVAGRLRVEPAPGGRARVRLGGCRPREALLLLSAAMKRYEAWREGWRVERAVFEEAGDRSQTLAAILRRLEQGDGPAVIQAPKLVGTAR